MLVDSFDSGSARFAFTDRTGGVSAAPYDSLNLGGGVGDTPDAVAENQRRLASAIGLPASRLVFPRQVHGVDVAVVDGPWPAGALPPQVDAIVTTSAELGLVVVVADCFPVLLADDDSGMVAAAHVGRRGLAAGLVPRVVAAMADLGGSPERIDAVVGPGICGACYEVPPDLHAEVSAIVPEASSRTRRRDSGARHPRRNPCATAASGRAPSRPQRRPMHVRGRRVVLAPTPSSDGPTRRRRLAPGMTR